MHINFNAVKGSVLSIFMLLVVLLSGCYTGQKQAWLRRTQLTNADRSTKVVKVYMDKYGYFYPSLSVPMDSITFFNPQGIHPKAADTASANLYHYFTTYPANMALLCNNYKVKQNTSLNNEYYAVQERVLQDYSNRIHKLVIATKARTIVFLIHGFNDTSAMNEYQIFEDLVKTGGYDQKAKPVYVEIYWDGLNAHGKNPVFAGIWPQAQNNTRYVSLALRDLMGHIKDRLSFAVVTHSLGASIGTGALFNTTSKWKSRPQDPQIEKELDSLMQIRPPLDVRVRLAMIAPAIPGESTFADFNLRSDSAFTAAKNKIDRIIIGYNPYDYATSKAFIKNKAWLAPLGGSTTLGCDYNYPKKPDEIDHVFNKLTNLGYDPKALVVPLMFTTKSMKHGRQEHGMQYYMEDKAQMQLFLDALFDN